MVYVRTVFDSAEIGAENRRVKKKIIEQKMFVAFRVACLIELVVLRLKAHRMSSCVA